MTVFNPFAAIKALFRPDYTNPKERYVYLDGSPYGSKGTMRFLTTPVYQAATIGDVLVSAAKIMTDAPEKRQNEVISNFFHVMSIYAFYYIIDRRHEKTYLPQLQNAVIDKTGRAVSDPLTLMLAKGDLSYTAKSSFFVGVPIGIVIGYFSNDPSLLTYMLARGILCHRTAQKLDNKQWTIQTNPPEIKKPVKYSQPLVAPSGVTSFVSRRFASVPC